MKSVRCFSCNKYGYFAQDCRSTSNKREQSNICTTQEFEHDSGEEKLLAWVASGSSTICKSDWIVDSGATQHMSPNKEWFSEYRPITQKPVYTANSGQMKAIGIGKMEVKFQGDNQVSTIVLKDVLHIPELSANLISVGRLSDLDWEINTKGKLTV